MSSNDHSTRREAFPDFAKVMTGLLGTENEHFNHITTKLSNPNQDQRHKYHHLRTTLKMTNAQAVETSVTNNNSLLNDYLHPDDQTRQTFH